MKYNLQQALPILERTPAVLDQLLRGLDSSWTQSNEGPQTWSPFDVVGHLIHGEKTDWIPRIQIVLSDGEDKTFTPYNRFAQQETSLGKDMEQLLDEFSAARAQNIQYLRSLHLTLEDFKKQGIHPELGPVTLEELLSSWVVHDLGHIVQVSRVMAKQYKNNCGPWPKYLTVLNS